MQAHPKNERLNKRTTRLLAVETTKFTAENKQKQQHFTGKNEHNVNIQLYLKHNTTTPTSTTEQRQRDGRAALLLRDPVDISVFGSARRNTLTSRPPRSLLFGARKCSLWLAESHCQQRARAKTTNRNVHGFIFETGAFASRRRPQQTSRT